MLARPNDLFLMSIICAPSVLRKSGRIRATGENKISHLKSCAFSLKTPTEKTASYHFILASMVYSMKHFVRDKIILEMLSTIDFLIQGHTVGSSMSALVDYVMLILSLFVNGLLFEQTRGIFPGRVSDITCPKKSL